MVRCGSCGKAYPNDLELSQDHDRDDCHLRVVRQRDRLKAALEGVIEKAREPRWLDDDNELTDDRSIALGVITEIANAALKEAGDATD